MFQVKADARVASIPRRADGVRPAGPAARWSRATAPLVLVAMAVCACSSSPHTVSDLRGVTASRGAPMMQVDGGVDELRRDLEALCWSVRIQCDSGGGGRPWTVLAQFNSPARVLSTANARGTGRSLYEALRETQLAVHDQLGIDRDHFAQERDEGDLDALWRLESRCSWLRIEYLNPSTGPVRYQIAARAAKRLKGRASASTIAEGRSFDAAVSEALRDLGA